MTSEKNIGAPVRVERHDPEVVAAVAKAKAIDPEEVKVVGRLEGLLINEEAARQVAVAASASLMEARKIYERAEAAYTAAVATRKEEEARVNAEGNADG